MNAFQEAIKSLLIKARDEGMTQAEAAAQLGVASWQIAYRSKQLGVEWPRGRRIDSSPDERALDIIARSEAGETLESMGERYGVTRERVRQIIKKYGGRSKREMHNDALMKLAGFLKNNPMTLSEATRELGISTHKLHDAASVGGVKFLKRSVALQAKLEELSELVRGGASFRNAAKRNANLARLLKEYCDERGIKNRYSTRWSISPMRGEVITRLYLEGKSWAEISAAVEELEQVDLKAGAVRTWAYLNLELPRRKQVAKRRQIRIPRTPRQHKEPAARVPVDPVEIDLRSTVRETAIVNRDKATAAQIAAACGCTRNSVIGHWFRARQEGAIA